MIIRLLCLFGLICIAFVCAQDKGISVSITDVEIVVSDSADQIDIKQGKKFKAEYPTAVSNAVSVESFQHIFVNFKLKNKQTGAAVRAHQAVVRIIHTGTQEDSFVVAEYNAAKGYSAHVVVKDLRNDFHAGKDNYEFELIVGDASFSAPVSWKLASNVNLKLNATAATESPFGARPEIKHVFRVPEKRPPATISFAFTIAVLAPIAILVIGWPLAGANLWNFPTGAAFIPAVAFQVTVGAILALYFFYWAGLNMMQTLTYLSFLFVPFLFFGSKTLNHLATATAAKSHTD